MTDRAAIISQASAMMAGSSGPAPTTPAAPAATTGAAPGATLTPAAAPSGVTPAVAPGAQPAAPADPWEAAKAEIPKPRIQSAHDRIIAKQVAQLEAQKRAPLEQQLTQTQQQLQEYQAQQQLQASKFTELLNKGDIDGALKVRGLDVNFEQLQRKLLESQGMLNPEHSRIAELERQLKERDDREQKAQAEARQRWEQQQRAEEWQQGVMSVKTDIAAQSLPGAKELAEAPGFAETVLRTMSENLGLTLPQATAMVRDRYFAMVQGIIPAFANQLSSTPASAQPGRPPAGPPGMPGASNSQPAAAPPEAQQTPEQRRRAIIAQAVSLMGQRG